MHQLSSSIDRIAILSCFLFASNFAKAQEPSPPQKIEAPAGHQMPGKVPLTILLPPPVLEFKDEIKPLPPVAIPDDPPPHEGAFFDLPVTIEPPDIIIVEVLEALPGRPITGERLVRPDGTISLNFYGDVYVRGLTIEQAKVKVLLHLRKWINDEVLGLLIPNGPPGEEEMFVVPFPEGGRNPFEPELSPKSIPPAQTKPDTEAKPTDKKEGRPTSLLRSNLRSAKRIVRRTKQTPPSLTLKVDRFDPAQDDKKPEPPAVPEPVKVANDPAQFQAPYTVVNPAESLRVFVDIVSFNTKVYFVQGDVGVPGRLPITGKETVLDALNYAGGFLPTAEPTDIHLYRPAQGGKPAKDYKIDYEAIMKGVATANLQVFPNDRLMIGRNPIVKKTVELDRAASPINSVMDSILQHSLAARSMAAINAPPSSGNGSTQIKVNGQNMPLSLSDTTTMSPAQRDAMLKEWYEFLWSITSKESGAMIDEKVFRDALMKKLAPPPEPK